MNNDTKTRIAGWRQSIGTRLAAAAVAGVLTVSLASQPALAGGKEQSPGPSAQDQVEDLVVCYARGTDAIGRATDATGDQPLDSTVNLTSEGFAEGLSYYRKCFAQGFSFTLAFNGTPALTVPDPENPLPTADAALQWANFVNNAFRGPAYQATQHLMGSISSSIQGNRGTAQSYLSATHVYSPESAGTGVYLVTGTYTDQVVRQKGRWLIQQRTLDITATVDVPGAP